MSIEDKLKQLMEIEEENKVLEKAAAAFSKKSRKFVSPSRKCIPIMDLMDLNSEDLSKTEEAPNKFSCYLCDGGHYVRDCVRLKLARKLLKDYDKEKKRKKGFKVVNDRITRERRLRLNF